MDDNQRKNIIDEHFWFTATILGVNVSILGLEKIMFPQSITVVVVAFLNAFAFHLILDRSSAYARGNGLNEEGKPHIDFKQSYRIVLAERFKLTFWEFKNSLKLIPFLFVEMGSSLFYLLLVVVSCIAAIYKIIYTF